MFGIAWVISFPLIDSEAIALHDCDIITCNKSLLARLVYPVANPKFNLIFAKVIIQEFQKQKLEEELQDS